MRLSLSQAWGEKDRFHLARVHTGGTTWLSCFFTRPATKNTSTPPSGLEDLVGCPSRTGAPGESPWSLQPQVPSQGERPRQTDRGLRPLRCVKGGGCQAGPKTIEDRSYWDSLAPRFRSSEGHWYTPTSDSRTRPVKESHVRTMCIHFLLTMLVTRRVTENHLPNHQPGLSSKFVRMLLKPS